MVSDSGQPVTLGREGHAVEGHRDELLVLAVQHEGCPRAFGITPQSQGRAHGRDLLAEVDVQSTVSTR